MSVLIVPTSNDPYAVQRSDFEGKEYVLSFQWSTRQGVWYMDVADQEGAPIVQGVKLILGVALLRRVSDARRPPGEFAIISSDGTDTPPGIDDLLPDGRCQLIYLTSDELV